MQEAPSFEQAVSEMQYVCAEAYAGGMHPSKSGNASICVNAGAADLPNNMEDGLVLDVVGQPLHGIRDQLFLVTGSNQRLSRVGSAKSVEDMEKTCGLVRVNEDGTKLTQVWGYNNPTGRVTSEVDTHFRVQEAIGTGGVHHAHPHALTALMYLATVDEAGTETPVLNNDSFNELLYQRAFEGFAYLEKGGAVIPPLVPGTPKIGHETASKFEGEDAVDIVAWDLHGFVTAHPDGLDPAWNNMETAEHAAHNYQLCLQAAGNVAELLGGTRMAIRKVPIEANDPAAGALENLVATFGKGSPQIIDQLRSRSELLPA